jgi:hypothetical protein
MFESLAQLADQPLLNQILILSFVIANSDRVHLWSHVVFEI